MIPLGTLASAHHASGGASLTYSLAATMDGSASMSGSGPYTATVTSVAIGTAASDRTIILVYALKGTGSIAPTAVTIGGISATIDATVANRYGHVIARAVVPTGTTATVTADMSASVAAYSIAAYRVTGGTVVVADSDVYNSGAATTTTTVDGVAGGFIAACSYARFGGSRTWTGTTEDYAPYTSFASVATASSGPVTATCAWGNGSNSQALAVAYTA